MENFFLAFESTPGDCNMDKLLFRKQDYVAYDPLTNKSTCLQCEQQFAGCIVGNIKRHYETLHNMSFLKRRRTPSLPQAAKLKKTTTTQEGLDTTQEAHNGRELKLKRDEFLKCCVGLVTVKNLSPLLFDDEKYFKKIIAPYEEEYQLNLNSSNIMDNVELWSMKIFGQLKSRFWQKRINFKIDLVKRQQKNLILINVNSMENFRMQSFTLGIVQLECWHNDLLLKDEILNCLQEFDIDWRQLYAITGDNCGQLSEVLNALRQEIEESANEDDKDLLRSTTSLKTRPFILKCGYHWLQLAVQGYFATVDNSLAECRKAVNHLKIKYDVPTYNTITPVLDNPLQWESTLNMVCSLKEFLANHNDLDMKIEWMFVEQFIEALTPLLECLQQLQGEQYIVGDFYRDWLLCEVKLRQMEQNEHALKILEIMMDLKETMISNEAFNAALYFDPRFNYLDSPYLNEQKRKEAVDHILILGNKANSHNATAALAASFQNNDNETKPIFCSDDPYNILELELHTLLRKNTSNADDNLSFRQKLEKLSHNQRQPYAVNVLDYWRNQRLTDKNVLSALNVTLAITIGQVTVEKAYSALSKTSINENSLRDILLVNLNESVLDATTAS